MKPKPKRKRHQRRTIERLSGLVVRSLTPDLVLNEFKHLQEKSPLGGHCYTATEAMYYLLGGRDGDYMPARLIHEGSKHYYLKHRQTGDVLDLTAAQFDEPPPYDRGRGCAYRKAKPGKRAAIVIERVRQRGR